MSINTALPLAQALYSQLGESQFRQQLLLVLQQLAQTTSVYGLAAPNVIMNGTWWITVNESTQHVTFNYQDSAGARHTLALGTYV